MNIKDKLTSWYIQNILIPGSEKIKAPGFIVTEVSDKKNKTYLREIALSATVLSNLETAVVNKYKDRGKQCLYSAGKKFGFAYSALADFPKVSATKEKEFKKFFDYLILYISAMYAEKMETEINIKNKEIKYNMWGYIICEKNGLGYIMTSGGAAGISAYVMEDNDVEAVQYQCEGKGDAHCSIIASPKSVLEKTKYELFSEPNLPSLQFNKDYYNLNLIRPTKYSTTSLQNMIDSGIFNYSHGKLTYGNERYLIAESNLIFYIEEELKKIEENCETLFNVTFDYGKKIADDLNEKSLEFVPNFLSALGWGDILILKEKEKIKVYVTYLPWSPLAINTKMTYLRGLLSGLITGITKKEAIFKQCDLNITKDDFTLYCES